MMRNRWKMTALLLALCVVASCAAEKVELQKSPCVGLDDSPCGPKRWVNEAPV
jgi:hypothetical protein